MQKVIVLKAKSKKNSNESKATPVLIGALSKSGAVTLMKTYRDKVGANLLDNEPRYEEHTGHWVFRATMPWEP